jgi:hypothetical protein
VENMVKPKIDVNRYDVVEDYHIENIIESMLKAGLTEIQDTRQYELRIENQEQKYKFTASINVKITGLPDTALETAKEEEE